MEKKSEDRILQKSEGQRQQASHAGTGGGHAGQHSGGMGGERGGDLHDVGSGQSGMTGRGGMGGNDTDALQSAQHERPGDDDGDPRDELIGQDEGAEVQEGGQREGFGNRQSDSRGQGDRQK
jgi:hypothetical protein